jgi:hypothetical protein
MGRVHRDDNLVGYDDRRLRQVVLLLLATSTGNKHTKRPDPKVARKYQMSRDTTATGQGA